MKNISIFFSCFYSFFLHSLYHSSRFLSFFLRNHVVLLFQPLFLSLGFRSHSRFTTDTICRCFASSPNLLYLIRIRIPDIYFFSDPVLTRFEFEHSILDSVTLSLLLEVLFDGYSSLESSILKKGLDPFAFLLDNCIN